jgi:hypothetical protein
MKINVAHHVLHDRFCRAPGCDPKECSQRRPAVTGNGGAPSVINSKDRSTVNMGANKASTTPLLRRVVEPGPPDPVPTGAPIISGSQPGPASRSASGASTSAKTQPKPKKKKKKAAQPTRAPSYDYYDVSEEEELPEWQMHVARRAFMIGRQLDLDEEVEYDLNGEGWCIFCHGPSSGRYIHSCPGYSD